ncbi:hypothetical protein Q668_06925 [Alcanivorax sp. PN-3]|nr:hypothetical protein Q668_06925 [Alcanivorax sp. PN-3]
MMDDDLGIRHQFLEKTFIKIVFSVRTVHNELPATTRSKIKYFECI